MSRDNPLPAQPPAGLAFATLAGGCFWCTEAVFEQVDGVLDVESGYTDGQMANPDYEAICTGRTGHAEAVRLLFDPARISYRDLLQIFMATHDPTSLNRQGNDVGTQYRSAIFFHDAEQERVARELIASLQTECDAPIVTQLSAAPVWWRAEDYHQEYYRHHPHQGYCAFVIAPKLHKLQSLFRSRLKKA